ncbi:hypothetical protein W02_28510 [Nitrospira sp. KM1]|uniref:hypothetical protein n=1 Tax=Nitrospira sp. KM1 TaxID=1936990 RepID=UPI0013A76323|nr:hypothetical protein [Nitrospira sp. KM1]BCA55711.1 hypothetical protein W02_28510 [Nitrospira sp. KM1]
MRVRMLMALALTVGGCGPHYTIPNFDTDEIEKVVSSGRSPQGCIEGLKEDAKQLNVKVRLVDMQHQETSGPIAWIYSNTYVCTGKVVQTRAEHGSVEKQPL